MTDNTQSIHPSHGIPPGVKLLLDQTTMALLWWEQTCLRDGGSLSLKELREHQQRWLTELSHTSSLTDHSVSSSKPLEPSNTGLTTYTKGLSLSESPWKS